jgi:hypothetical protein
MATARREGMVPRRAGAGFARPVAISDSIGFLRLLGSFGFSIDAASLGPARIEGCFLGSSPGGGSNEALTLVL